MHELDVTEVLTPRRGHFALESGHHGDLWLDLELLCRNPAFIRRAASELAVRIAQRRVEMVCAPLVEGAFVGLMAACELDVPFVYTKRFIGERLHASSQYDYRLPAVLRHEVAGKRVAIVDDVINAGSAVVATHAAVKACGGEPVVIGALAVLGQTALSTVRDAGVALEPLVEIPNEIWLPADCPLCRQGEPLAAFDADSHS